MDDGIRQNIKCIFWISLIMVKDFKEKAGGVDGVSVRVL